MRQSMNVHLRSKTSKLMIMMLDPIATVPRVAEAIILDNNFWRVGEGYIRTDALLVSFFQSKTCLHRLAWWLEGI